MQKINNKKKEKMNIISHFEDYCEIPNIQLNKHAYSNEGKNRLKGKIHKAESIRDMKSRFSIFIKFSLFSFLLHDFPFLSFTHDDKNKRTNNNNNEENDDRNIVLFDLNCVQVNPRFLPLFTHTILRPKI
jgi:hypothetical protein